MAIVWYIGRWPMQGWVPVAFSSSERGRMSRRRPATLRVATTAAALILRSVDHRACDYGRDSAATRLSPGFGGVLLLLVVNGG